MTHPSGGAKFEIDAAVNIACSVWPDSVCACAVCFSWQTVLGSLLLYHCDLSKQAINSDKKLLLGSHNNG